MLRTSLLAGSCLLAALAAQCPRPPIPPGGLAFEERPAERVIYTDGATTEGRLIVPTGAAPVCGWPLIVYVHSLGSQRDQDLGWQRHLASRGFAVWAYDVRGQAMARFLSSTVGTTMYGPNERYDLAEQILHVRGAHVGLVHATKLAVIGDSQGGIHAWMAAAQSGRSLTLAARGTIDFPVVTCVVGADFVPEPTRHRVRGGTLFASPFIDLCTLDPASLPYLVDAGFAATVSQYFAAQDPAGLAAWLRADPGRLVEDDLATCTVPILVHHAWHDSICGIGPILDAVQRLPTSTPFRLVASTVGHAVPRNEYELALRRQLSERWLERFLWDEPNHVDEEARFLLAWMPLETQQQQDPATLWEHTHVTALPSRDAVPARWYTNDSGGMSATEPTSSGTPTRIEHLVAPGFDAQAWLADPGVRALANVLQQIPMSERSFQSVLAHDVDLVGIPHVRLRVTPDAARFMVCALLSVRLPGSQEDRMLSHWGIGVLDATPGVATTVEFPLSPIAARIPQGATLILTLRNHWVPEAPHLRGLVAVPLFQSFRLDVAHGNGQDSSYVELPVLNEPAASLVASGLSLQAASPAVIDFGIDAGGSRAGWRYLVAVSMSGHGPGIPLPGGILPIRLDDATTTFAAAIGTPELRDFAGVLDGTGRGAAALDLRGLRTLPPELVGLRLSFATWTFRSLFDLSGAPTNPVDLIVR